MQHSILNYIGNTPLVKLSKVTEGLEAEVWAKLEYFNPSGSLKDRIALRMIEDAEKAGILKPGMTIVEASTGNTATSLAFVGAVKGYKVVLYVPEGVTSEERIRICKSYGAEVVSVDIKDESVKEQHGVHGAIVELIPREVCLKKEQEDPNVWWARQFSNPSNALAHEEQLGGK